MARRKGEPIRLHDERAVVKHARRPRPTDGRFTSCTMMCDTTSVASARRAARPNGPSAPQRHHRAGDAERDAAEVRQDRPEQSRPARRALEDRPANEQLAVSCVESLEKHARCACSGHRAGRFVRPDEDFAQHRAFERCRECSIPARRRSSRGTSSSVTGPSSRCAIAAPAKPIGIVRSSG